MSPPLRVLFRAEGFVAVDKPAGALVIPGRNVGSDPSLRDVLSEQLGQPVWVVHRLDRETSGVLLFALDAARHRTLSMAFEAGEVRKRYQALVAGRVAGPLELTYPLVSARRGRVRIAREGEAGKPAHSRVRPLETYAGASWVEVEPLTGRQHQIRVHLAAAGHPLLVDVQYGRPPGPAAAGLVRTPLHAAVVSLPRLEGIEPVDLEAPTPADLTAVLSVLRGAQRST
jgi:RluA family pseudouridine synthase